MAVVSSAYLEHHLHHQREVDINTLPIAISSPLLTPFPYLSEKPAVVPDRNLLQVSPYDEVPHLLDLRTLDIPNQILAKALVHLQCLREDYATAPYVEIFNWSEVINAVRQLAAASSFGWRESSFYIVVFRSRIPPTTLHEDLHDLDKAAHAEATASGGFLKYWFGTPDKDGRNLATCVWRNQHDARIGSVGEAHRKAAGKTRFLYTEWRIERLKLTIKDEAASWEIVQWD